MTTRAYCCKYAAHQYFRATKAMLLTIESILWVSKGFLFFVFFCGLFFFQYLLFIKYFMIPFMHDLAGTTEWKSTQLGDK